MGASCRSSTIWDRKACKSNSESPLKKELLLWFHGCCVGYEIHLLPFQMDIVSLVFQGRDGAEAIRRPSDPRVELLWSQQDVLPLVQTVSEHRQTHVSIGMLAEILGLISAARREGGQRRSGPWRGRSRQIGIVVLKVVRLPSELSF